ncbi:hypothetical protein [Desulfovibrio intestinalis]|uniref:Uncharacterized protein n=1 Tax=Desulfovibrio intestinalis TaxID=58621 RepID=A0A7W8C112_9BACT|nr:hypothetical protein [Desulfovibrio intestinalis]MBB5143647.1 hypothetical protein [Desulfovibrio intestinalis]
MNTAKNDENMPVAKGHVVKVEVLPPEVYPVAPDAEMIRGVTENLLNTALDKIENTHPDRLKKLKTITFRQHFSTVPTQMEVIVDLGD